MQFARRNLATLIRIYVLSAVARVKRRIVSNIRQGIDIIKKIVLDSGRIRGTSRVAVGVKSWNGLGSGKRTWSVSEEPRRRGKKKKKETGENKGHMCIIVWREAKDPGAPRMLM